MSGTLSSNPVRASPVPWSQPLAPFNRRSSSAASFNLSAKSRMALLPIRASSWLSLMSTLKIWTGRFKGAPRDIKSSTTASQHLSSHVIMTSTSPPSVPKLPLSPWDTWSKRGVPGIHSWNRSGFAFTSLFLSNMGKTPLLRYNRGSLAYNSSYMSE